MAFRILHKHNWSVTAMVEWKERVKEEFPNAILFSDLFEKTKTPLEGLGLTPKNTLFANATCRDEINQRDIRVFGEYWGENFDLSGLGGIPSAGLTGFSAYSHHVSEGGILFILYGPHIGVNSEGELGKVLRVGMKHETSSCGALIAFHSKILGNANYEPTNDILDSEQALLERELLPHASDILSSDSPIKAVTNHAYTVIDHMMSKIIERSEYKGKIVLLGGVIINTPGGGPDYFDTRRFELLNFGDDSGDRLSDIV